MMTIIARVPYKDLLCREFHERTSHVIQLDEGKRKYSYSVQQFALGPVFIDSPYHADNFALKKKRIKLSLYIIKILE